MTPAERGPRERQLSTLGRRPARVSATRRLGGRPLIHADGTRILFSSGGRRYLATRTRWPASRTVPRAARVSPADATSGPDDAAELAAHAGYGGRSSFVVDMQGIDAFLYGRAKIFRDETARQAAIALGLVHADARYLRVGAAGAPPRAFHPGGEVLEHSLLRGPALDGWSQTASGFLPDGRAFSSASPLVAPGSPRTLLETRSIYSHTAFLAEEDPGDPHSASVTIAGERGGLDVLSSVTDFIRAHGVQAYAVRLFVSTFRRADPPVVIGRVLRRLPHRPLRSVQEATDIASEQTFTLRAGQRLHCFGTHYPRSTPAWERFRGGRPYEPRGHLHMAVCGGPVDERQHAISHLRQLVLPPGAECRVLLTPVTDTVHVEPVSVRGGRAVSRCSGRAVAVVDSASWREVSADDRGL